MRATLLLLGSLPLAVAHTTLGYDAAAQETGATLSAGDFRILAIDRTFNYKRGSAVGTVEFRRDGTLIYRARGTPERSDLDGSWAFDDDRLCLRIATVNDGAADCAAISVLGRNDFELDDGTQIFR